ncbi:hypothetical protein [Methylocystis bryophila]|uniref:hypothetical protein n=1 Tax=Methylocystis bryophila TaxID=655015 RepID=UPI00131A1023|nr:hypothetical protein [Methylocystis bryophila]
MPRENRASAPPSSSAAAARSLPRKAFAFGAHRLLGALGAAAVIFVVVGLSAPAEAVPSFARQTGQPCATCHTNFPELTPYGRRFKLGGYTATGGTEPWEVPPIAAMVLPTFTKTKVQQDMPPTNTGGYPDAHVNDNFVMQQASLFYGGKIYENLGAFVQGTYDKADQRTFLDNTDIRYTRTVNIGGIDAIIGLNANNNPTVQDVWNTTPAWGFPYVAASLGPAFSPPGTQIEGSWAGTTVGTGAYAFLNDMLYVETSLYHPMSKGMLGALGYACGYNADYISNVQQGWAPLAYPSVAGLPFPAWQPFTQNPQNYTIACSSSSLANASPYWRVALEKNWGEHSLMIGAFGFYPDVLPGRIIGYGVDHYRDIGLDAQYQYISGVHALTLQLTHISEMQNLKGTYAQGIASQFIAANNILNIYGLPVSGGYASSSNPLNYLTSFKATAGYTWDHTLSGYVSYFHVTGSPDFTLYGNAMLGWLGSVSAGGLGGYPNSGPSAVGLPNGAGLIFDFAYMPFSKGGPEAWPWANAKIGVSYTHYLSMWGGTSNFDGNGIFYNGSSWRTHSATDNNTLFFYTWIAF